METILTYDKELFLFLNNLGNPSWDAFWMFITNKWASIPLYIFLLLLSIKTFGVKKTLWMLLVVGVMVAATDQLTNAFKYGFQRLRPCHDEGVFSMMRLVKSSCGGKYGYFSAHAANAFGVATFFSLYFIKNYKRISFFLLLWAILVAYSRIYIGVHFPLDVLTGMTIGAIYAFIFYRLFTYISNKITS